MLTGDNAETAAAIGREAEVDEIFAELLPQDKEKKIRELKNDGRVVMVGDGINDAPALTSADIGVAIGAGTAVAIDAAEVVLLKNSLFDVVAAIRLSRATLRDIKQNLFWAFAYNTAGIPLAAGCFIPFGGWELNPMFAAAAMSLSSFCVVSNALRLNTFKLYPDVYSATKGLAKLPEMSDNRQSDVEMSAVENIKSNEEEKTMEVVMKISGMMCSHCEGRVKKALENLPEVSEAKVSHTAGEARVSLSCEVADDVLRAAVEAQDYEVLECTRG